MEENKTNTEIPKEKKETTSPVYKNNSEVPVVSPQNTTKNEVSVEDITKLYKVIEEQKKETENLKKLLEEKKVENKSKQVERSTNIIENSESDEDKVDNSKIINGVFVK